MTMAPSPVENECQAGSPTAEERRWAAYVHQTLGWMFLVYLWFGALVATTVLMEVYKTRSRFVVFHARQVLFVQLVIIGMIGPAWITSKFVKLTDVPTAVRIPLAVWTVAGILVFIVALPSALLAASRVRAGEDFEYWLVGRWARKSLEHSPASSEEGSSG